jgi:IclR family pca regulon transcriptional regulator
MPRTAPLLPPPLDGRQQIPSLREPRYSQSLERGLAILRCFTPERPVLGIAEIADELLIMSRSTTHRYVITLVALGYLEQNASRKYRLGLRVTDLGMSALNATGLRGHSRTYLEELRQRTSYTANLAVLDGPEILYVDRARSFRRGQSKIDLGPAPGSRVPAYCTAMGKLLLAYLPEHEQRNLLSEMRLTKRGPNTITSKKGLRGELERVRESGVAIDDHEFAADLVSISVPVRGLSGDVIAALSVEAYGASTGVDEITIDSKRHLVSVAGRLSEHLRAESRTKQSTTTSNE